MQAPKPLVLLILDGWGYKESSKWNAIAQAHTPHWDAWWQSRPHRLLSASGLDVGLPPGQMGNSEVGHMHIGAGRVIYQDLTRINQAISRGDFFHNDVLLSLIRDMKVRQKTLHIMGLLSAGGVHSHQEHLFAFLKLCHQEKFTACALHLFLDGRDTPPKSALSSIEALQEVLTRYPVANIRSISGRYFAMDRDKHWDRILLTFEAIAAGKAQNHFSDAKTAIHNYYEKNISDEFIPPTLIGKKEAMQDGDGLFFFNFRPDRARQLTEAFATQSFTGFQRSYHFRLSHFVSMTNYTNTKTTIPAFPPQILNNTLGEIIAANGLHQLRMAETEKYAHVTYFFNGGREQIFPNEERILIPSPPVATYDLLPEMNAPLLTKTLIDEIHKDKYDLIICNYANADMVGHSGNLEATIRAITCLDTCIGQIGALVEEKGGNLLITSDHGNAETMYDEINAQPYTAHTSVPVPLLYIGKGWHFKEGNGSLIDIAPTLLTLLGIERPNDMTGQTLLIAENDGAY